VELAGLGRMCEPWQLAFGRSAPHNEPAPQPLVEIGEALEHEARTVPAGVAPVQQTIVEAEHRNDRPAALESRRQRGMVVDPQVARQPEECRHCLLIPVSAFAVERRITKELIAQRGRSRR
jgi:hypothetical protein